MTNSSTAWGYMALHGIGTEPSPEIAYQYWKKAVPLKNKDALYALGKLCLDPAFPGFSPQEGERYLWESWSKHKNLQAAYLLGKAYAQGTVLPRDMEKALELLNTVAEKGNPYAQYLLGKIYYWGNGVEQDREKGLEYIRQAAEQGHPGAVGFWSGSPNGKAKEATNKLFPRSHWPPGCSSKWSRFSAANSTSTRPWPAGGRQTPPEDC